MYVSLKEVKVADILGLILKTSHGRLNVGRLHDHEWGRSRGVPNIDYFPTQVDMQ